MCSMSSGFVQLSLCTFNQAVLNFVPFYYISQYKVVTKSNFCSTTVHHKVSPDTLYPVPQQEGNDGREGDIMPPFPYLAHRAPKCINRTVIVVELYTKYSEAAWCADCVCRIICVTDQPRHSEASPVRLTEAEGRVEQERGRRKQGHQVSSVHFVVGHACQPRGRRSLSFIHKCFFFRSSNLVKFVARYGVMSGRCKSTLGSNIHSCVSRFNFNQWAFFDGCVNADNVIREHCFSLARLIPFWRSLVHARINSST